MAAEILGNGVAYFFSRYTHTSAAVVVVVVVMVKVEKSADSASVSDQRTGAKRGIGRSTSGRERSWTRDEDGDRETAKITFGFKRR